jgi:hypothetical protein
MTEADFRRRLAEAYGRGLSSPSILRLVASAALAASADRASSTDRPPRWFAVGSTIFIAALVVGTMLAAAAVHRAIAPLAPAAQTVPSATPVLRSVRVTWAQAQTDSPDPLLVPGWLPFNRYRPSVVQEVKGLDGRALETITEYQSPDGRSVLIHQNHHFGAYVTVPGPSKPGMIGDQPATFYQYVSEAPTAVIWKLPDGEYVAITTDGLSAEEMTHIATALHP